MTESKKNIQELSASTQFRSANLVNKGRDIGAGVSLTPQGSCVFVTGFERQTLDDAELAYEPKKNEARRRGAKVFGN